VLINKPPIASPLTVGPRMDLPRIGLQLLSHFSNKEHNTFGYVATPPILPSFSLLCPHLGPDYASRPSPLPLRPSIGPALNQNGCASIHKPTNSTPSRPSYVTASNSGQFHSPLGTPSGTKTNNIDTERPLIGEALDKTIVDSINSKNKDAGSTYNSNTPTTNDIKSDSKNEKNIENSQSNRNSIIGERVVTTNDHIYIHINRCIYIYRYICTHICIYICMCTLTYR
jgi:hypothetical protein